MCYNVKLKVTKKELADRLDAQFSNTVGALQEYETVSGFAHPKLPIVTSEEPGKIELVEWGLVPGWIKDERAATEIQNATLNARSETLFEKPSFKSILKKRCLIPVNGFYEWQTRSIAKRKKQEKVPYYIHLKSESLFAFGGLYDEWVNTRTGEICKGFSIITVPANPLMEIIHYTKKRMPLILPRATEKNWLQQGISEMNIKSFFTQYPDSDMQAEELITENDRNTESTGLLF